mmetsp:Transcript_17823/g.30976  ORF Transcript_17823/g.30976 Transcript_17823/m.30976 type:complete len:92 (+) Transcript_17823:749-1024(+)
MDLYPTTFLSSSILAAMVTEVDRVRIWARFELEAETMRWTDLEHFAMLWYPTIAEPLAVDTNPAKLILCRMDHLFLKKRTANRITVGCRLQ